jgi:hypothetical protein
VSLIVEIAKETWSLLSAFLPFLQRGKGERDAGGNPHAALRDHTDELLDGALGRLGAMSFDDTFFQKMAHAAGGKLVRTENFSKPFVREWISHPDAKMALKRIVKTQLASAPESIEDREALIASYMKISGEHRSYAESCLFDAVAFLSTSVRLAINDPGVAAILMAGLETIHGRIDDVINRLGVSTSPPLDWSVDLARRANHQWLANVFCNKRQAKLFLRQPISPGDTSQGKPAVRDLLVGTMMPLLTDQPDGKVVALTGDEGNGKSWLVAYSWLSLQEKPLMVVLTADDFSENFSARDLKKLLIDKLIEQTNGFQSESFYNWWLRELDLRRGGERPNTLWLVVVIDGLNQRPSVDWGQMIDAMSAELERIGGRLIFTARTAYYSSRVKRRLLSQIIEVKVPEWTDAERNAILAERGIVGADLRPNVAASLRNPRLLGIALDLLQSAEIQELEELSVSRLLFEHMRMHERDAPSLRTAQEFARTLQEHARTILDRLSAQTRDDLKIFDGGLEAVSDGRFFIPVKGDSTRYSLDEGGLTLALGFAVLDELRAAHRNGRDLADAMASMIEPISALDRTADAIIAALTVACLDEECPAEIGSAIVTAFAALQNPNDDEFPAFAALAQKRPEAFMCAVHHISLAPARPANFDWIEEALQEAKHESVAWNVMAPILHSWLGYYSLLPETRMFLHRPHSSEEEVRKERLKRQDELNIKLEALSESETALLEKLTRNDGVDLAMLGRVSLTLLAGKPLAPFATALAHWSFANALNGPLHAPDDDVVHLVRLNRIDWLEARAAILKACNRFCGVNLSRTGKWALVNLLRATGDHDDATRAGALVEELTADRENFGSWRRIENYCATDPCNPESETPPNVEKTAENFATIDVSKVRTVMGHTSEDHFFVDTRPGLARFESLVGVDKHREFIAQVLERNGLPLRQGIFEARNHNALVTHEHAVRLVDRVKTGDVTGACVGLSESDRWIVPQFHLLIAFPFLSANDQVESLCSEHVSENFLHDLLDVAKPLDEETFESLLDTAVREDDERLQFIVLAFGGGTETPLSKKARGHVIELAKSSSERVRAQALGLIANIGNEQAIESVVKSCWGASTATRENGLEIWNGSFVILEACSRGMISYEEALARISPEFYGLAAKRLGKNAAHELAKFIDASIRKVAVLELDDATLDIELTVEAEDGTKWPRYRISEKANPSSDLRNEFERLSETSEAFEERQRRLQSAFEAFDVELTKANARILLERFRISEFDALVEANRELAQSWFDLFMRLPQKRRGAIHNLGLFLAHGLANWNPDQAARLFISMEESESLVRITYGRAGITLDAMALWSANDHSELKDLRFKRLNNSGNNNEIAQEVLAALWSGKQALLREYIETQLDVGQPTNIARALMVAGFSDHNEFNDGILARYKDTPGFIGEAQTAAMYAYERNIWSKHWFALMRGTQKPEDFWRYSVLLTKIIDGRFDTWGTEDANAGEPYRMFWPSVERQLKQRYERWHNVREKKLFGDKAPSRIFLALD